MIVYRVGFVDSNGSVRSRDFSSFELALSYFLRRVGKYREVRFRARVVEEDNSNENV